MAMKRRRDDNPGMPKSENSLIAKIDELRRSRGLSRTAVARAAGLDPSMIRKLEQRGPHASLRADTARRLAAALGVSATTFLDHAQDDAAPARSAAPDSGLGDVPVLGTAKGSAGEGAFSLVDEAIEYVTRPAGLSRARDVYALYVQGESMSPRFEPGDLVFVHPKRPPRFGDYIILQVQMYDTAGIQTYIKRLIRQSDSKIEVEQLNPHLRVEWKPRVILRLHKVLTPNELYIN